MGQGSAPTRSGGERTRMTLVVLGWVTVGAAAPLLMRGLWPAAIACLLAGGAVLWRAGQLLTPRGADAYLRRVADALTMRVVETEAAYDEPRRRAAALRARCRRLRPPPGMEGLHERLLALSDDAADAADLPGHAARAAGAFAELDALRRELAGVGATDAERRYASAAAELVTARLRVADAAHARAEEADRRARARLAGVRPPGRAHAQHQAMLDAFVAQALADGAVHAACRAGDAAGARAAAERALAAAKVTERAWDALVAALDRDTRRPTAER
jgi:hypothetical protein